MSLLTSQRKQAVRQTLNQLPATTSTNLPAPILSSFPLDKGKGGSPCNATCTWILPFPSPSGPWAMDYLLCLLHCPQPQPLSFNWHLFINKYIQGSCILSSSFHSKTSSESHPHSVLPFFILLFMLHFLQFDLCPTIPCSHQSIPNFR